MLCRITNIYCEILNCEDHKFHPCLSAGHIYDFHIHLFIFMQFLMVHGECINNETSGNMESNKFENKMADSWSALSNQIVVKPFKENAK